MDEGIENIIRIASEEFRKLFPSSVAAGIEVEEIEKTTSGNYFVTLGYWSRDNKPSVEQGKPEFGVIGNHPIKDPNHHSNLGNLCPKPRRKRSAPGSVRWKSVPTTSRKLPPRSKNDTNSFSILASPDDFRNAIAANPASQPDSQLRRRSP